MLAEATTTEISKEEQPKTFHENIIAAKQGGGIAGDARKAIEKRTGKPVISPQNALDFSRSLADAVELGDEE